MAKICRNKLPEDDLPILKGLLKYGMAPEYMSKFIILILEWLGRSRMPGRGEKGEG